MIRDFYEREERGENMRGEEICFWQAKQTIKREEKRVTFVFPEHTVRHTHTYSFVINKTDPVVLCLSAASCSFAPARSSLLIPGRICNHLQENALHERERHGNQKETTAARVS